ncbi:MAG: 50S ribosomal protein L3 [Deltaproteobacteria bacterium]|nr:MAG: 50S ribosomal protein L3 [Deltaproteobacteria bacterium]
MANESMGLLGRKLGMTQFFRDDGEVVAVTLIEAGPCPVLQVKTEDGSDGYNAVQLGFGDQKEHRINKPEKGHFDKAGVSVKRAVKEIRVSKDKASSVERGQTLKVSDIFEVGQRVDVTGTSKGRGFAGVMKRYHFAGFIRTHGTHEFFRHGGSIGTRLTPGMVLKGKKMPGHMGNVKTTVQNLAVERIDEERNLIMVRGGVPGPNGGLVILRDAVKSTK